MSHRWLLVQLIPQVQYQLNFFERNARSTESKSIWPRDISVSVSVNIARSRGELFQIIRNKFLMRWISWNLKSTNFSPSFKIECPMRREYKLSVLFDVFNYRYHYHSSYTWRWLFIISETYYHKGHSRVDCSHWATSQRNYLAERC